MTTHPTTGGPLRVLYVIEGLGGSGGAEQSLRALAPEVAARGHELTVVTLDPRAELGDDLVAAGAEVVVPPARLGWRAAVGAVRREIRRRNPDLVHTTLFRADVAGRVAASATRTPVVSSLVNSSYGPEHLGDPGVRRSRLLGARALDAVTARPVRRFHALSTHVADVMSGRLLIPRRRIEVIPRGRGPATVGTWSVERRRAVRAGLGIDDDRPLVLAAARHEHQKGLDVLIAAVPAILAARPGALVLVGGRAGNQTARLEAQAARVDAGERLRFIGSRDDVPDLMVAADAFVMPSRWEGLGSILVEAMATEVPTVASDIPPVRETVGGIGWARLVPPDDPAALAGGVLAALAEPPSEARRRGALARARFDEHFTAGAVADRMIDFWRRASA